MEDFILAAGPLTVVLGCQYWVMSPGKEQEKLNTELWAKHGK